MNNMISFTVPGNPLPKQSYKAVKGGGYTPKRIKLWQKDISTIAMVSMRNAELDRFNGGKLHVSMIFYRADRRRCDLDNLSKAVLDAMNGIVYEDDKQVHQLHLTKDYDRDYPRVEVRVSQYV